MDRVPSKPRLNIPFIGAHLKPPAASPRLHGVRSMRDNVRNHVIAVISEFVGTFLFLFFAFAGTTAASLSPTAGLDQSSRTPDYMYSCLAFGFSLAVNAWVFYRVSGGLFNPAVTFGMILIGAITWFRGFLIFLAQMVGGIAAAAVVSGLYPGPITVVSTKLQDDTSIVRGLFIEMFLTAQLVLTIFMLAAEKHRGTFLAPIGIGLALFIAELAGIPYTGGSLNPARSFGPATVSGTFPGYHWIYWLGPWMGSVLAVIFYRLVKALEYETCNPHQDDDHVLGGSVKDVSGSSSPARPDTDDSATPVNKETRSLGQQQYDAGTQRLDAAGNQRLDANNQRLDGPNPRVDPGHRRFDSAETAV